MVRHDNALHQRIQFELRISLPATSRISCIRLSTSDTLHPEMSGVAPPWLKVIPDKPTTSASRAASARSRPLPPTRTGGMGSLDWKGIDRVANHAVMPTCEGDLLFTVEQTLNEGHSLRQPFDPDASRVEVQTRLSIFGLHVPG